MRIVSRTVRRRSGRRPSPAAIVRRVQRRGGARRMRAMIRLSAANSSGVHAANDLLRQIWASEAISPRRASSSRSSPSGCGSVAGICRTASVSTAAVAVDRHGSGSDSRCVEEEASEHPVVARDLIASSHQRGTARPVEVEQVGRIERGRGLRVRQHIAGSDRDACLTKLACELDEQGDERLVTHRTRSPRGSRGRARGRRAP